MVAGAVEDGELALPELVGLGKVLVELRDVQQVRVQPGQGVGYVSVSETCKHILGCMSIHRLTEQRTS